MNEDINVRVPHTVLSFASFRALLRYASRTENSCTSPQCGQSSLSFLLHNARRLCTSVPIPVGTCRPLFGQLKSSPDGRCLAPSDIGPGSAGASGLKGRSA
jgi:hypothetical protein